MTDPTPPDTDTLERVFHEPNRLAIMSAVCAAVDGITFRDLKDACSLTDGNLNRHLKVLEEARVIRITKTFVDAKPRTTVHLSRTGLKRFQDYLAALELVLQSARNAIPREERARASLPLGKTVTA